jgi:hypothetical protein
MLTAGLATALYDATWSPAHESRSEQYARLSEVVDGVVDACMTALIPEQVRDENSLEGAGGEVPG